MGMKDHEIDYVGLEIDIMVGLHQWDKSGQLWCVLTKGGSKPAPSQVQPICYRLSDLDKFIPELGFVPIERIRLLTDANHFKYIERFIYDHEDGSFVLLPFWVIELLIKWNFWVFDQEYFTQGLVIDKLKQEL